MGTAALRAQLDQLLATDVSSLEPTELAAEAIEFEKLRSQFEAISMARLAAVEERKPFSRHYRRLSQVLLKSGGGGPPLGGAVMASSGGLRKHS